jgi:hypothetical protein
MLQGGGRPQPTSAPPPQATVAAAAWAPPQAAEAPLASAAVAAAAAAHPAQPPLSSQHPCARSQQPRPRPRRLPADGDARGWVVTRGAAAKRRRAWPPSKGCSWGGPRWRRTTPSAGRGGRGCAPTAVAQCASGAPGWARSALATPDHGTRGTRPSLQTQAGRGWTPALRWGSQTP